MIGLSIPATVISRFGPWAVNLNQLLAWDAELQAWELSYVAQLVLKPVIHVPEVIFDVGIVKAVAQLSLEEAADWYPQFT
jgi:hypothetical protein